MRTNIRTDVKLMVAFRNFANAPKNVQKIARTCNTYTLAHYLNYSLVHTVPR